ncbi:MAG: S53 family peptidase [Thermoplasmata archaeon]|nr:S53 family peptidase [Thermoplasmata archaeon]
MRPARTRRGLAALAVWVAVITIVSGAPGISAAKALPPATTPATVSPSTAQPSEVMPAFVSMPWSERAGYYPQYWGSVSNETPLTSTINIEVTFWPRDMSLYLPLAAGAPPLTLAQFNAEYSPSNATYEAVASYLTERGLTVVDTEPDRMSLGLVGAAADVGSAFGTSLMAGRWHGDLVHVPLTAPSLPGNLAGSIAAISGLADGFTQFSLPLNRMPYPSTTVAPAPIPLQARTTSFITPGEVRNVYDADDLYNYSGSAHWATSVGIALVLWGDGFDPTDVSTFFDSDYPSEFPTPTISYVNVDGAPAPSAAALDDPSNAPQELTLDIEWSGSMAPGAQLFAVYAPDGPSTNGYSPSDSTLEDALNRAAGLAAVEVVSMSFATPDGADPAFQTAFSTTFASGTARGLTFLAASGDDGGTNNPKGACTNIPEPEFPAASPDVLAVGGTALSVGLTLTGGIDGIAAEPAWKDSGGGFSVTYDAPKWQLVGSAASVIGPTGRRGIPDVSAPAADNFFYYNGQNAAGNGTSFASPTWAGLVAEMDAIHGQALPSLGPRIYGIGAAEEVGSDAQGLADITTGSNCLGNATVGWDTATGWGSPRALALYQDLVSSYVTVNLTLGQSIVPPGGDVAASAEIANATDHAPIDNVTVNFTVSSPGYIGPCAGTLGVAAQATGTNGVAAASIPVPACYFGDSVFVVASVTSRGYFGMNQSSARVNLLGYLPSLTFLQSGPWNVIGFAVIVSAATAFSWWLGRRKGTPLSFVRWFSRSAPPVAGTPGPGPPAPADPDASGGGILPAGIFGGTPATSIGAAPSDGSTCIRCGGALDPTIDFCPRCGHERGPEPSTPAPPA